MVDTEVFIDASHNCHKKDHTGHSAMMLRLLPNSAGVVYKSNKQNRCVESPMESEILAFNEYHNYGIWINWLLNPNLSSICSNNQQRYQ